MKVDELITSYADQQKALLEKQYKELDALQSQLQERMEAGLGDLWNDFRPMLLDKPNLVQKGSQYCLVARFAGSDELRLRSFDVEIGPDDETLIGYSGTTRYQLMRMAGKFLSDLRAEYAGWKQKKIRADIDDRVRRFVKQPTFSRSDALNLLDELRAEMPQFSQDWQMAYSQWDMWRQEYDVYQANLKLEERRNQERQERWQAYLDERDEVLERNEARLRQVQSLLEGRPLRYWKLIYAVKVWNEVEDESTTDLRKEYVLTDSWNLDGYWQVVQNGKKHWIKYLNVVSVEGPIDAPVRWQEWPSDLCSRRWVDGAPQDCALLWLIGTATDEEIDALIQSAGFEALPEEPEFEN